MGSTEEKEFLLKGDDKITDYKQRVETLKLFPGKCTMSGYEVGVMIKKGPELKMETYRIMQKVKHNTLIPHLNFYPETNAGRLVIPIPKASFETWIKDEGRGLLIDEHGNMTTLFKTMVVDICDALEKLYEKGIKIKNLDWNNLYLAREVVHRILLLVTEAEPLGKGLSDDAKWKPVKQIVDWCFEECKVDPSNRSARFIGFIGTKRFTVKSLRRYPENWDILTKRDYLLALIEAKSNAMNTAIEKITWPLENGELPDLLNEIVKHQERIHIDYEKTGLGYVNLIRDTYKHFNKFPLSIKDQLGTEDGLIKMVEVVT